MVVSKRLMSLTFVLLFISALCCGLVLIRFRVQGNIRYLFFIWNLFLCWVPYFLSMIIYDRCMVLRKSGLITIILGLIWFLFYPNSIYIVTDFIHLSLVDFFGENFIPHINIPLWFDFIIFLLFIMTGFIIGIISLYLIQEIIDFKYGILPSWLFTTFVFFLSSYGIYIGRFYRLNSWDVLARPMILVNNIIDSLNINTLYFMLLFTLAFISIYLIFYMLIRLYKKD